MRPHTTQPVVGTGGQSSMGFGLAPGVPEPSSLAVLMLPAFPRDPEPSCVLSAPETAYAPDGCGIRPSCMSSETWS